MSAEPSARPDRLEQHAAEIEAAVQRTAARFSEVPVVETVTLRLMVLLGREISVADSNRRCVRMASTKPNSER